MQMRVMHTLVKFGDANAAFASVKHKLCTVWDYYFDKLISMNKYYEDGKLFVEEIDMMLLWTSLHDWTGTW